MDSLNNENVAAILVSVKDRIKEKKQELTKLDSELGDGDLGLTMDKGFSAICSSLEKYKGEPDIGKFIKQLGFCMADAVPSTMGTLLSIGIIKAGGTVAGKPEITIEDLPDMLRSAADTISMRGKTKRGDKTILDAMYPALDEMQKAVSQKASFKNIFEAALSGARAGAESTKQMKSTIGKAAVYGDQSIGKQDPGATVMVHIFEGICNYFK